MPPPVWRPIHPFLILCYAVILHAAWGVMLLFSSNQLRTTPLAYTTLHFGQQFGGAVIFVSALLAVYGLYNPGLVGLLISLPQNALLFVAATSGVVSAVTGHYPDGVIRPHEFILTDQLPMIGLAPLHALALVFYHGRAWNPKGR